MNLLLVIHFSINMLHKVYVSHLFRYSVKVWEPDEVYIAAYVCVSACHSSIDSGDYKVPKVMQPTENY